MKKLTQAVLKQDADALLAELGWKDAKEDERVQIMTSLMNHFHKLILETIVVNLPEDKVKEFELALQGDPAEVEDKVIAITVGMPGLDEKLEQALLAELETIRSVNEAVA